VTPLSFLDTNILLYSISDAPAESPKRAIARELLERDDCALSVQVLQEFYVQATRATRAHPVSHQIALGLIETWMRFPIQETTLAVMSGALEIVSVHRLSYWDSAVVAAARALGCRTLYSEDMTDGRELEGLTILNPFRERNRLRRR
jgi:predicted nucleic acid-binding protein